MAVNSQKKQYLEEENNQQTLSIKDFMLMCLSKWYWFVASFAVVMTLAVAYILVKEPSYTRSSQVLIKSGSEGSSISNAVGEFSNLGLFSTNSNVYNELIAINSPSVMMEVVERLELNMKYKIDGTFHKKTVYGSNLPINVKFLDLDENTSAKVEVDIDENGVVTLSDFMMRVDDEKTKSDEVVSGLMIEPISTPIGHIAVTPTLNWVEGQAYHIYVTKSGLHSTAQACQKKLEVSIDNKDADVINLSYIDVSPQRAVDVLNEVINVYNEKWLDDKNKVTVSTSRFIAERLDSIVKELGDVDESISSYKSQQLLPDMATATNMYMSQSSKHMEDMLKINNELAMAKYILNYVRKDENRRKLLPANSGLSSKGVEAQLGKSNRDGFGLAFGAEAVAAAGTDDDGGTADGGIDFNRGAGNIYVHGNVGIAGGRNHYALAKHAKSLLYADFQMGMVSPPAGQNPAAALLMMAGLCYNRRWEFIREVESFETIPCVPVRAFDALFCSVRSGRSGDHHHRSRRRGNPYGFFHRRNGG